ncbi:glycosyltransferase family 2 protein [Actinoplanes sp. NPDC051851]|uniref:glycosyltransferase family 2 protein n=1 Tax=Actinoplanes sp. NPDC051851 TaxID=3154753 RepID=UPI0034359087
MLQQACTAGYDQPAQHGSPLGPPARRDLWLVRAVLIGGGILALAVVTGYVCGAITDPLLLAGWITGTGVLLWRFHAVHTSSRFLRHPAAPGRIVAIVSAREPEGEDLHACVWSILNQRGVVVDQVHVVDDGSTSRPAQPFPHPRVRWHRKAYGGRRAAEAYVLARLGRGDWDFVLTLDGDAVLDERAVEYQLRAFSLPEVTATTGTVTVRNDRERLLTRIVDLHLGASFGRRANRPSRGTPEVIPGVPVLCRADVAFEYRDRRLACGPDGAAHSLSVYAARHGGVAGVREAVTWIREPAGAATTYRQWLRWSTAWWTSSPVLADMGRWTLPRVLGLARSLAESPAIGCLLVALAAVLGGQGGPWWRPVAAYAALHLMARYATTGLYLLERPETYRRRGSWSWLLLIPAEAVFGLLFAVPVKCAALLTLCRRGRRIRRRPVPFAEPATGAIYHSGRIGEGA